MNKEEWPYKPNMIQIEAVQGCNRHCQFCGTAGMERGFHYASAETIRHTAALIRKSGINTRILLAGHGEPTMHPHIVQIVRILRKKLPTTMIHMFTNGTILQKHPERVIDLFAAGLNDLVFDEYSDSRVGEFVRNDPICRSYTIVEQGRGTPLFAGKNHKQQRICITPPIDEGGNTSNRKIINHCGAGGPKLEKPMVQVCTTIFRDFFVRWDGKVAICCNDFRGEYYVTDIMQCKTLHEAYFNERLEAARRLIMNKERSAVYPCCICNDRPIRPGLLPDAQGQMTMPKPRKSDYDIVKIKSKPLSKIVLRDYEVQK